jgi:hypothetical protein
LASLALGVAGCTARTPPPSLDIDASARPPVAASPRADIPVLGAAPDPSLFVGTDGVSVLVPPESPINAPLPIFARVSSEIGAVTLHLVYKSFGAATWTTVAMKSFADGYAAEVPCDKLTIAAPLKFYLIALDGDGAPVATAGSRKEPFHTDVKNRIEGAPPTLPGKKPPKACALVE